MNHEAKALKSGLWFILSFFIVRGSSYLTTPVFTRLLSKEQFGIYSNYNSWLAILTILFTLNLYATLITARYDFEEDLNNFVFSALLLSMLSVAVWAVILNLFFDYFSKILLMNRLYMNIMLAYLFFLPAVDFFQTEQKYLFEYKQSTIVSVLVALGTVIFPLTLIFVLDNPLTGLILGSALSTIIAGCVLFFILKRNSRPKLQYWGYTLRVGLPYVPHALSLTILSSMDRVMITYICGAEDTALYSLAYQCGSATMLLLMAINLAYAPWLAEKLVKKEYDRIRSFSVKYIFIGLSLAVGIILIAPEILMIFGGATYMEAEAVMLPLIIGCVCQFLYTMYVNIEQCEKKTIGMAIASFSAAVLNFVLNAIFIPRFGYIAAAYTTLVGYLWLLFVHFLLVRRIGLHRLYNGKMVLGALCVSVLVAIACRFLYTRTLLRYIVIAAYCAALLLICWKNRAMIIHLIRGNFDK